MSKLPQNHTCRSRTLVEDHENGGHLILRPLGLNYPHTLRTMSYHDIITIDPGKRGGQPCIRGMRITVYDVLSYLASGMTEEQVLADFPYLTREDILACLSYAAEREHRMLVANE